MSGFQAPSAWWSFARRCATQQDLARGAAIGYQGVELLPHELWDAARSAGLTIVTEGSGPNRARAEPLRASCRYRGGAKRKLDLAVRYGVPNLIVFSGNRAGLTDEAGALRHGGGFKPARATAEAAGVTLVLELLNFESDHIDYQCDYSAWGVDDPGQLPVGQAALRHLPHANHGRRHHPHHPADCAAHRPCPYCGQPGPPRPGRHQGAVLPAHHGRACRDGRRWSARGQEFIPEGRRTRQREAARSSFVMPEPARWRRFAGRPRLRRPESGSFIKMTPAAPSMKG